MLTIKKEICNHYELADNLWSQGYRNYCDFIDMGYGEELMNLLEEVFPDGATDTEINDFLWFEYDYICEYLGIKEDEEDEE